MTLVRLPLLQSGRPDAVLVWQADRAITRTQFAQLAVQLTPRLPDAAHAINLCTGRLNFLLGAAASALCGQVTLLPPNQTPAAVTQLQQQYADHYVLDDAMLSQLASSLPFAGERQREADQFSKRPLPSPSPASEEERLFVNGDAALLTLFTSGSTGAPQPQEKTWASLSTTAQLDTQRFAPSPINLVATVPSQHMFGLQTTVLLPLLGGCAIHDSRPFFPADIRAALEAIPAPRALIITPTHLRACIAAGIELPELQFVLSATAPLPLELAQQAEARWHTKVLEIYGSTEAGTMGTRRSTASEWWQLMRGTRMEPVGNGTLFHAPHLPQPLLLTDHVELHSATQFRLLGRATDQIKIAGKRTSLAELTNALLKIPGVQDAAVFLPANAERTAALVVAPQLSTAQVLDALAQEVDAVFLPRPLLLLKQLPRNEVGKLTQAALTNALRSHGQVQP